MQLNIIDVRNKILDGYLASKNKYSPIITGLFSTYLERLPKSVEIALDFYFVGEKRQNSTINILMEVNAWVDKQAAIKTISKLHQLIKDFFSYNNIPLVPCSLSIFENNKVISIESACRDK